MTELKHLQEQYNPLINYIHEQNPLAVWTNTSLTDTLNERLPPKHRVNTRQIKRIINMHPILKIKVLNTKYYKQLFKLEKK